MKKKILLYGPVLADLEGAYGGGTGGYTRKMSLYLYHFRSDRFEFTPCYHTVAGQFRFGFFAIRLIVDVWRFLVGAIRVRPSMVHVLAQYRRAIPREFAVVLLARLLGIRVTYEIKAGVFVEWYTHTNPLFRWMVRFCIRQSAIVLCQGMPYVDLIREKMQKEAHYYPNFVPLEEIPDQVTAKLDQVALRVLFVGYAFREKGVYELVEACRQASEKVPVVLTLVGKEHEEFAEWLDRFEAGAGLSIRRLGRLPHEEVLREYQQNDIYAYPTRHAGEGHNNSINEAMMMGLIIITTRQGFMESILGPDRAYFLDEVSSEQIVQALLAIHQDRPGAKEKGKQARKYLLEHFTSEVAFARLQSLYEQALA